MKKILCILGENLGLIQRVSDICAKVAMVFVGGALLADLIREKMRKETKEPEQITATPIGFRVHADAVVSRKP